MQRRASLGLPPGDTDPFFELHKCPKYEADECSEVRIVTCKNQVSQVSSLDICCVDGMRRLHRNLPAKYLNCRDQRTLT